MTSAPLPRLRFESVITTALNIPQVRVRLYKKTDILNNSNLKKHIVSLFVNSGFKNHYKEDEIDFVLALVEDNKPIAVLVLREYFYSPRSRKKFLHIEYGMTSPLYEGKGFSTLLRKICLAFAYDQKYGGVTSYAISHGSQVPLKKLGFKVFAPMKYTLMLNQNNNRLSLQGLFEAGNMKLSPSRELFYTKERQKLKKQIIANSMKNKLGIRKKKIAQLNTSFQHPNINISKMQNSHRRLQALRPYYESNRRFKPHSMQTLETQYVAEMLKKHMPNNTRNLQWLNTGMQIQGLCPNKQCPNVSPSTYRPWISHVFTFASQKTKLMQVTGDLLAALRKEKNKKPKVFKPKVSQSSRKPTKVIKKSKTRASV